MNYKNYTGSGTDFYQTTSAVAETVNLAIKLQRPILVEGEPGCGKTKLAHSVAAELGLGEPIELRIKSTTQAKDLLYRFDALRRLQEVQNPQFAERARYVYPYISLQRLGLAIQAGKPCVVLIDEIDKADIDFPNDLLDVFDQFSFDIEDLPQEEDQRCRAERSFGRMVKSTPDLKPIVVITSNREKQLPEPFLRRCIYLELVFPKDPGLLAAIVRKNLDHSADDLASDLIAAAVERFLAIRDQARKAGADQKLPATSELIDWIRILHWRGQAPERIRNSEGLPPYHEVLFKTANDRRRFEGEAS
jgi:MoxR-like ATPase